MENNVTVSLRDWEEKVRDQRSLEILCGLLGLEGQLSAAQVRVICGLQVDKIPDTFFSAEDKSHIQVTILGEGMDTGDKSVNKALSAAFKYACFQLFCIPTEELHDSEEDHYEVEDRKITKEEMEKLISASKRTNMNLDGYLKQHGVPLENMGYRTFCSIMIKLANADSVVPKSEEEPEVPEDDSGLPFQ